MVRKTTRVAALKASEKTKPTRRSRRHKSTSESDSSGNESLSSVAQKQKKPIEKDSSGESDTDSKKPLKKRTRSKAQKQTEAEPTPKKTKEPSNRRAKNKQQQPEVEEVNQDVDSKGKSVSIDRCNSDSVDSETANQNVQVTDESPVDTKDDDNPPDVEVSKNGKEIPTEIDVNVSESIVAEMSCDNQSSEIVSEEKCEAAVSDLPSVENTPDLTQSNVEEPAADEATVQSVDSNQAEPAEESVKTQPEPEEQKVAEEPQEDKRRTRKLKLNRKPIEPVVEPQPTPTEEKKEEVTEPKKKITLKRPEISKTEEKPADSEAKSPQTQEQPESQSGSVYESNSKDSEQCDKPPEGAEPKSAKKIVLKRPVSEDHQSDKEKNDKVGLESSSSNEESRKRRLSTTDNIVINQRRRRSSVVEKSASESEDKPEKVKKPTKVVKLIRKLPQVSEDTPTTGEEKKFKWSKIQLSNEVEMIQFDSVKEICPTVGFLEETEVDLELEVKKSPEKSRRLTFKELEEEEMESIEAELNAESEKMEVNENVIARNRKISVVDDTASKLNPPPTPPRNPPSEVLYITNLVRPFTVKQLKELLERTGKIKEDGFWTDKIKSKCYVCYETVEEAEATRNALHGIHWPIGNGKKLNIDYATLEDMDKAKNPPLPVQPKEKSPEKENENPDIHERREEGRDVRTSTREWDEGKVEEQRRQSRSRSRDRSERKHRRAYTPEIHHKKRKHEEQVEQKAMDDLFLKTKATPSIYWQPLSPEEIARKQQQRQARLEENKRRLEEIRSSGRGSFRDRSGRDRNFRRR